MFEVKIVEIERWRDDLSPKTILVYIKRICRLYVYGLKAGIPNHFLYVGSVKDSIKAYNELRAFEDSLGAVGRTSPDIAQFSGFSFHINFNMSGIHIYVRMFIKASPLTL